MVELAEIEPAAIHRLATVATLFRSYARQSVVELAEIEPATIHRLATVATLFRSDARQSVVELAEIEPASIHRLAIRRGGLTLNVPKNRMTNP